MDTDTDQLTALNHYVAHHTWAVASPRANAPEDVVDVHFMKIGVHNDFDADEFQRLLVDWVDHGQGAFGEMPSWDAIKGGPSFIQWGYWLGSQDIALRFMALGHHARLWDVVTPALLHITGEEADRLAGGGFVMTSGIVDKDIG